MKKDVNRVNVVISLKMDVSWRDALKMRLMGMSNYFKHTEHDA